MLVHRFWQSRQGNFATMFGIALIPLLLGTGMAVDYSRYMNAKGHMQDLADSAVLAAAAADLDTDADVRKQADDYIQANYDPDTVDAVAIQKSGIEDDTYTVDLSGSLKTYFLGIANIGHLDVDAEAVAVRGVSGSVEVALVLDNTTSMGGTDAKGVTRIKALRDAGKTLVAALHENKDASVRIGVVPYANYVNVGMANRHQPWVDVDDDVKIVHTPDQSSCGITQTRTGNRCIRRGPKVPCTSVHDGVVEHRMCQGECLETEEYSYDYTPSCDSWTETREWHGCVGTRVKGDLRLSDDSPSIPYPGYIESKSYCPTPITPLTAEEETVQDAVAKMQAGNDDGELNTYIPGGLVWGLNVLSQKTPFSEGKAYDPDNKDPRKVVVLMTDGQNTMRYRESDGKHTKMNVLDDSGDLVVYAPGQAKKTRDDTLALCANLKARKIEIFSVAFSVKSSDSKELLQGCASDKDHYFDATDSDALKTAFGDIAENLKMVRLAR